MVKLEQLLVAADHNGLEMLEEIEQKGDFTHCK
jgi:hypothetical protein